MINESRSYKHRAISCNSIARIELYDFALSNDYIYYEEKPQCFSEDFKFIKGIYFRGTERRISYTTISKTMIVREDKDGIYRVYYKPKILMYLEDGTTVEKMYTDYDYAKEKYKKIIKQANLLEL